MWAIALVGLLCEWWPGSGGHLAFFLICEICVERLSLASRVRVPTLVGFCSRTKSPTKVGTLTLVKTRHDQSADYVTTASTRCARVSSSDLCSPDHQPPVGPALCESRDGRGQNQ